MRAFPAGLEGNRQAQLPRLSEDGRMRDWQESSREYQAAWGQLPPWLPPLVRPSSAGAAGPAP